MLALKRLLALNGLVFLLRAALNLIRPTSFYLADGAPENAVDAVHVLGVTYAAFGFIQLGMWRSNDRTAVRVVAQGSLLFALGVAIKALSQDSAPPDTFHQIRLASATENAFLVVIYAALLNRERKQHRATK